MSIKLSNDEIMVLNVFSQVTHADARDCLLEPLRVVFLVKSSEMGKAIGKNGSTVKRLAEKFKRKVEVVEYAEEPETFFKHAFKDVGFKHLALRNEGVEKILEASADAENKRVLFQNMAKFKYIKKLMERNYGIQDVRVR
ncbi:MAG: NusA-like transcription termination signal-binding factor [Candidatus Diapherotrites archaeon]|nr:NusA-like transcription termination signal-binding factor [Candidatus Diapherotrites archaeon]